MASGSGKGRSTKTKSSTSASKRGKKRTTNTGRWVADKSGRTGHWEGGGIYDDLPF